MDEYAESPIPEIQELHAMYSRQMEKMFYGRAIILIFAPVLFIFTLSNLLSHEPVNVPLLFLFLLFTFILCILLIYKSKIPKKFILKARALQLKHENNLDYLDKSKEEIERENQEPRVVGCIIS